MPSKIDFYGLSRPVQDRFAAATRGTAPPAPLLFRRASRAGAWAYLGAAVLLAGVEAALLAAGCGDARSALALHGPRLVAFDMILIAAASYCAAHGVGLLLALEALPWRAGLYLFPGCAVDASRSILKVWPIEAVVSVEALGVPSPAVVLHTRDGSRVVVAAPDAAQAARVRDALETVRRDEAVAIAADDSRIMVELDPLHDRAMSSPIGPTEGMKRQVPLWTRFDWALAAVLGVGVGQGLGAARNALSDAAMYRAAVQEGTSSGYEAYLKHAGRHAEEVRGVLLPRVELRRAEAAGTVDAVLAFARAHPSSKIDPEIQASLRRAMLAELGKAVKVGSVTALDDFARHYPEPIVEPELEAARHALFAQSLAAWRAKARPDAAAAALMGRVVRWAEEARKPVEIRFRLKPSQSIADADKSVMRNIRYPGPDALPSHYVGADALRPYEQSVQDAIVQRFGDAFAPDVVAARGGDPLSADDPEPSRVAALIIEYSPEWTRSNTVCPKPLTVFSGLSFAFDASFSVPDARPPLRIAVRSQRVAESWKIRSKGLSLREFEQKVYGAMMAGAFDQLKRKIVGTVF